MATLNEKISNRIETEGPLDNISNSVTDNLNPNFELRPYQFQALARLNYYWNNPRLKTNPTHLLFHMATGSGKTIIMASSIIFLYQQGYRNFLFFVNSNNIIQKTKDNFLNQDSSKYLFANTIEIDGKTVEINEVSNFQVTSNDCINICFTTIQSLHTKLNEPSENNLTYEDFEDQKIVLISDEAHHINADTRNGLAQTELIESGTWENTINKIQKSNTDNALLEFTATIDLSNPNIVEKYSDKLIFDYPLREFRIDGYSKEVRVLQHDSTIINRAMIAVILSQYRLKLFQKNGLNIKPVILFKSKTIKESLEFHNLFIDYINNLNSDILSKIQNQIEDELLTIAFKFFENQNISLTNLVLELQESFGENKLIEVNSKQESEEKQIAVNSLEDKNNEYRCVFAVDKLNEGWDVLNLFDIVRINNNRDASNNKAGKTTISEAQLIGRGARYCPFTINEDDPKYQRKYDQELDNELKFCEELVYYSSYNPKYIQELKTELKKQGIIPDTHKKINLNLKDTFKESDFYKTAVVYTNERVKYDRKEIKKLNEIIQSKVYKVKLSSNISKSTLIFDDLSSNSINNSKNLPIIEFNQIPNNIKLKALNSIIFYRFDNLLTYLPNINSYINLLESKDYCSILKIEITTTKNSFEDLNNNELLFISKSVLEQVSAILKSEEVEYRGTEIFNGENLNNKLKNKVLNLAIETGEQQTGVSQNNNAKPEFQLNLNDKDWYVYEDNYGTSEEKLLVKTIDTYISKLSEKFEDIHLIRNEKIYKIYAIEDGKAYEPDYLLYLKQKGKKDTIQYQIFIEPKGGHLIENDQWKEDSLLQLESIAKIETHLENKHFKILGLPFYNNNQKIKFTNSLELLIDKNS
jgi:type III restriction enzyme